MGSLRRGRRGRLKMARPASLRPFPLALVVNPALYARVRFHHSLSCLVAHPLGDDFRRPAEVNECGIAFVELEAVPFWNKYQGEFAFQGCKSHAEMVDPDARQKLLKLRGKVLKSQTKVFGFRDLEFSEKVGRDRVSSGRRKRGFSGPRVWRHLTSGAEAPSRLWVVAWLKSCPFIS